MLKATLEYSGMIDFWSGNGRRWDDNAGCLFAPYDEQTTLRELVDSWVDDFNCGGDCDSFPDNVTSGDVRRAILDSFTPRGKKDYEENAICEFAYGLEEDVDCDGEFPVVVLLLEIID